MTRTTSIIIFLFFISLPVLAAEKIQALVVPFQNVTLNPGISVAASYSFGSFPMIFCYENNLQSVGVVTWPYQGVLQAAPLSLTLVTNSIFDGQFADPSGIITITNNQGTNLIISCEFAF